MPYVGLTTRESTCAICDKPMLVGTEVYHDSTKRQGSHLVHSDCWERLRESRKGQKKPTGTAKPERLSTEPLDPPF